MSAEANGVKPLTLSMLGHALKLYIVAVEHNTTEETVDKASNALYDLLDSIRMAGVFSTGEQVDDMSNEALQYFPVEMYLMHVLTLWPDIAQRKKKLEAAKKTAIHFIERCRDANIPYESLHLDNYLTGLEEGDIKVIRRVVSREEKIAKYKEEKARMQRIKGIISHIESIKRKCDDENNVDIEEDDKKRSDCITQIQACCTKALSEIASITDELELLEMRGNMEQNSINRPVSNDSPPVTKGIEVTRLNKIDGEIVMTRETVKSNVFAPRMQAPTKTLEEFAMEELAAAEERERKSAISDGNEPPRRYQQLEKDGDEDNIDLVEAATYQDREWDAFKEANPKGWGNRHGKKF